MIAPARVLVRNGRADASVGTLCRMHLVEVSAYPAEPDTATLTAFVGSVEADTGVRPLSDHLWLDLQRGGSVGFIVVRIALAQISAANHESALEVVVQARDDVPDAAGATDLARDAAATAIDAFRRAGGGDLTIWVDDDDVGTVLAEVSAEHDMTLRRSLHEMRVTLPLAQHAEVHTRPFVPGADDENWLRVNNRAFAEHGEQGGWTLDTLALRQREPWFDAEGFLVYEVDGQIAAFCWTKIHELQGTDRVGEIYVIAVDPEFHGRGLGKQLTLAGLDSLAARGVSTATLFVDGDNAAAVSLYRSLGFTTHRTRRAFGGRLHSTHQEQHDQSR
jgi:mycothiol synthase